MGWVSRLVEMGTDDPSGGTEVMEISRPCDLRNFTDLGLTLAEAKQLLARVQQAVADSRPSDHSVWRPCCASCGGMYQVKAGRLHQIATVRGMVKVGLPRFVCANCGRGEPGINWPAYCRSTPELGQVRAHLSALMPYRVAAGVRLHLLPVDAGKSPETLRSHTLRIGTQLRTAAVKPVAAETAITVTLDSTFIAGATTTNVTWRLASATSRRTTAAGRSSVPLRGLIRTSQR
jgi:hypothetical protein